MCGQHIVRASAEDKGHTPNPRTEIKIPDPAGNRTRAAGLEGRDFTDHATAHINLHIVLNNIFIIQSNMKGMNLSHPFK